MLFFFGIKGSSVHSELMMNKVCTYCQQQDTTYANFISRYFHFFWIPVFPVGKKAVSVCSHCKQTLNKKEMPEEYRIAAKELKSKAQIPVRHFSGLILVGLFILFVAALSLF